MTRMNIGGEEKYLHPFLTPALDGVDWLVLRLGRFPPIATLDGLKKRSISCLNRDPNPDFAVRILDLG